MNCQQPVADETAKFFHGTLVCNTCHTMAERLYSRARSELTDLLVMLQEGIRIAIIERRLHFKEGAGGEEMSKKEVLEAIVRLQEMKDARKLDPRSLPPPGTES
jgi:hypothetical protein